MCSMCRVSSRAVGRVGLIVVWMVATAATVGLALLGRELIREPVAAHPQPIVHDRGRDYDPNPWARWAVTEQLSAHYVLISHVETRYLDEAVGIAKQLAELIQEGIYGD